MSSTSVTSVSGGNGQPDTTSTNAFDNLGINDFVKLLVTELQSQDPLEPMDNSQILQQVSQIREIQSSTKLTETLSSVALGQNMSMAASLLKKNVTALTDAGKTITGTVDRVTIADGDVKVHIGGDTVKLSNISEIVDGTAK